MSLSPTSSNPSDGANKRRRTHRDSVSTEGTMLTHSPQMIPAQQQPPPGHIPKRGARACTACRKGKNRCEGEGEAPCRRCQVNGTPCVFEKPEKKPPQAVANASLERVARLENQYLVRISFQCISYIRSAITWGAIHVCSSCKAK